MTDRPRILLCASAGHCAQVLQAAAASRVALHGTVPHTQWPSHLPHNAVLLWALVPPPHSTWVQNCEAQWRTRMLQGHTATTIHMLYGSAEQQAQQMAAWLVAQASASAQPAPAATAAAAHCAECLDGGSEQALFRHLVQHTAAQDLSPPEPPIAAA